MSEQPVIIPTNTLKPGDRVVIEASGILQTATLPDVRVYLGRDDQLHALETTDVAPFWWPKQEGGAP
jgi:hypothetical protein